MIPAIALGGAALLVAVSLRYRLDATLCDAWPPLSTGAAFGALYLVAMAALTLAWRRATAGWLPWAVHSIALCALPFLSSDPLMYAAVGRALAGGASPTTPLRLALGDGHPFLVPLPPAWRDGGSAYGPLWNQLAAAIGRLCGDDLVATLRLHQLAAAAALLAGAVIASRAVADRRRAFLLIALCPVAIVEASVGAHNDALLVPFVAGAVLAWTRGRGPLAVALLAAAVAVKVSAAIVLLPVLLAIALAKVADARARRNLAIGAALAGAAALLLLPLLRDGPLDAVSRLVERPDVPFDHCTRSIECLPRVLLRFVLHAPTAAWAVGLAFRLLGIAWLCATALWAAEAPPAEAPGVIVRGLFFYFLALHGWAQSWYLLPLLPALPLLREDARWMPAIRLYLVTAVAYYAFVLPISCHGASALTAVGDLAEASITVLPPLVLLHRRRHA